MAKYFQEYAASIKFRIDRRVEDRIAALAGNIIHDSPAELQAALLGGKRIRGCLLCLITESLGGKLEGALLPAAAIELIHTATLIHDDYVDQDRIRRKLPAAWTLVGARRAVLLGDVIFASAIKSMNDSGREEGTIVSDTIAQVAAGALQEPLEPSNIRRQIESAKMDSSLYEKIIRLKTGILFAAACRLGALAARAPLNVRDDFQRWGQLIGEAYQLADDLHEIACITAGRCIEAKRLAPLAAACLHFTPDTRSFLLEVLKSGRINLTSFMRDRLQETARRMEQEVRHRLIQAVHGLRESILKQEYRVLISRTPMDLIAMFNAHDAPARSTNVA